MSTQTQSPTFGCHKISGGVAEGEILFSGDDMCFYLCDPKTGIVIEGGHQLKDTSIAAKILAFPSGKGSSVVQADGLYQLAMNNNAPRAIIVTHPDTVLVASCIILDIPMVDRMEPGFYAAAASGDVVRVDATAGVASIVRRGGP